MKEKARNFKRMDDDRRRVTVRLFRKCDLKELTGGDKVGGKNMVR